MWCYDLKVKLLPCPTLQDSFGPFCVFIISYGCFKYLKVISLTVVLSKTIRFGVEINVGAYNIDLCCLNRDIRWIIYYQNVFLQERIIRLTWQHHYWTKSCSIKLIILVPLFPNLDVSKFLRVVFLYGGCMENSVVKGRHSIQSARKNKIKSVCVHPTKTKTGRIIDTCFFKNCRNIKPGSVAFNVI